LTEDGNWDRRSKKFAQYKTHIVFVWATLTEHLTRKLKNAIVDWCQNVDALFQWRHGRGSTFVEQQPSFLKYFLPLSLDCSIKHNIPPVATLSNLKKPLPYAWTGIIVTMKTFSIQHLRAWLRLSRNCIPPFSRLEGLIVMKVFAPWIAVRLAEI
jgi:hypothetical protein